MLIVPLQSVPAQRVKTVLDNTIVTLSVYQRRYGMFIDVIINDRLVIGGVVCQNRNRIIRSDYLKQEHNFTGDFVFIDLQGDDNPLYPDLGARFQLAYLTAAEVVASGVR